MSFLNRASMERRNLLRCLACQGDMAVGLYSWAQNWLPLVTGKSSCNNLQSSCNNLQSRDLVLQLVERILSAPKARIILVNGAMKQVSQKIFSFAVEAAGEKIPELSKEATGIFIWCFDSKC